MTGIPSSLVHVGLILVPSLLAGGLVWRLLGSPFVAVAATLAMAHSVNIFWLDSPSLWLTWTLWGVTFVFVSWLFVIAWLTWRASRPTVKPSDLLVVLGVLALVAGGLAFWVLWFMPRKMEALGW